MVVKLVAWDYTGTLVGIRGPISYAPHVVRELNRLGIKQIIITRGHHFSTEDILERMGILHMFSDIRYSEGSEKAKVLLVASYESGIQIKNIPYQVAFIDDSRLTCESVRDKFKGIMAFTDAERADRWFAKVIPGYKKAKL